MSIWVFLPLDLYNTALKMMAFIASNRCRGRTRLHMARIMG